MTSISYRRWRTIRARALDEIAEAHVALGGSARGRRYATQQINRAYAVLLASHFQGFCRNLHLECVEHLLTILAPPVVLKDLLLTEMTRGRQLDRGNAQPSSLAADFRRLGIQLWPQLRAHTPAVDKWKDDLELLNDWRNAIVHEDFTSSKLAGIMTLRLSTVRRWRRSCGRLARLIDESMKQHMTSLTGQAPW